MNKPILLLICVSLHGCTAEKNAISEAKEAAAAKTRDPDAAKFRNVKLCPDDENWVTGQINGKNAFGAYVGFTNFYASGELAYLEEELASEFGWAVGEKILRCKGSTLTPELREGFIRGMPEELKADVLSDYD